jgi:hypothetical protein
MRILYSNRRQSLSVRNALRHSIAVLQLGESSGALLRLIT